MHPLFMGAALVSAMGAMMLVTLAIISLVVFGVFVSLVGSFSEAASALVWLYGQGWKSHPMMVATLIAITPALIFKGLYILARRRFRGFFDI